MWMFKLWIMKADLPVILFNKCWMGVIVLQVKVKTGFCSVCDGLY